MPTDTRIPLIGAANAYRSAAVGAQDSINLYAELTEDPQERAKGIGALYGTPGRHSFTSPIGPTYGLWSNNDRLFAVVVSTGTGRDLIEVDPSGAVLTRHNFTALDDGLPAQIFSNGNQLLIVSCGFAFCDDGSGPVLCTFDDFSGQVNTSSTAVSLLAANPGSTLIQFPLGGVWDGLTITINGVNYVVDHVVDGNNLVLTSSAGTQTNVLAIQLGDPVTALTGAYLDGYFIVQRPQGGTPDLGRTFNISGLLNGDSWDGLDFTSAEAEPSYITSLWADNEQLYVFKDASFQVYQNTGNGVGGFPFSNIEGAMARFGTVSRWSNTSLAGKVYLLGAPGGAGNASSGWISAWVLNGFTPQKISGHAQEAHWNKVGLGTNSIAYSYSEDGHNFWCINFGAECWCYDSEYGSWHQRQSWNGSSYQPYGTFFHAFVPNWTIQGVHVTGGPTEGFLYKSSVNYYDDDGDDVRWERTLPYIYQGGNQTYYGRMYLEMETGTTSSAVLAPFVWRQYSDDRGVTFSTPEPMPIGVAGQSAVRVIWPVANSSNSMGRIWRFFGVGQYKVALVDLALDVTAGTT